MRVSFRISCAFLAIALAAPSRGEEVSLAASGGDASASVRAAKVRTGQTRYDWEWLAKRCDENGDGLVSADELPISAEAFARLDRDWDGELSPVDFDWSAKGVLGVQKETTFALFKSIDISSEGRITRDEWEKAFAKAAGEKGYLDDAGLEKLIFQAKVIKRQKEQRARAALERFEQERASLIGEAPKPNERAPDFTLRSPDGAQTIQLSKLQGDKPVVLVFGNFTCGNFRTQAASVEEIFNRWKNHVNFVTVYLREAHLVGEQAATETNVKAGFLLKQPDTFAERCAVAQQCIDTLSIQSPLVVDEIDNRVGRAYAAFPDRLYVVDREGRIAFQGGPGPYAYNPEEMEQSLILLLLDQQPGSLPTDVSSGARP
jgi:hypothetical protein